MDEFQTKMVAMLTKLTHDVDDLKIGMGNLSIDVAKLAAWEQASMPDSMKAQGEVEMLATTQWMDGLSSPRRTAAPSAFKNVLPAGRHMHRLFGREFSCPSKKSCMCYSQLVTRV